MRTRATQRTATWFAIAWLAACGEAATRTQVVVIVDADSEVRASVETVEVRVADGGDEMRLDERRQARELPLRLVFAPEGTRASPSFELRVTALGAGDAVIAAGRLQTGFVRGQARFATLLLEHGCTEPPPLERAADSFGRNASDGPTLGACSADAAGGTGPAGGPTDGPDGGPACDADARCDDPCEALGDAAERCACQEGVWNDDGAHCAHWSESFVLAHDTAGAPSLAATARGEALVAFTQKEGTSTRAWATRFVPGQGFLTARSLEGLDATRRARDLHAVIDSSGNAAVLWASGAGDGELPGVRAALAESGSARFSEPVELAQPSAANGASYVGLAAASNAQGELAAVSGTTGPTSSSFVAWRYVRARGWSTPVALALGGADPAEQGLGLAISSDGMTFAGWSQPKRGDRRAQVWINRASRDALAGTAEVLDVTDALASRPELAISASGSVFAVWSRTLTRADGSRATIVARRFEPGAGWSDATVLQESDGRTASKPTVASDDFGNATALWTSDAQVYAATYRTSGGWTEAQPIDVDTAGDSSAPRAAANANGRVFAIWRRATEVWFAHRTLTSDWSRPYLLDISTIEPADDAPQIALDARGRALAVWSRANDTTRSLVVRRLE